MVELFNEDNIKLFRKKIFYFLNYTFPGVVALEVFFKKGFFSNTPEDLYQFILYILWCFVLSLPYNFIDTISSRDIINFVRKKELGDNYNKEELEKRLEDKKEEFEEFDSQVQYLFSIIYPLSSYIFYKIIIYNFQIKYFLDINIGFLMYCLCTLLTYLTFFPLLKFISKKILISYLKKKS